VEVPRCLIAQLAWHRSTVTAAERRGCDKTVSIRAASGAWHRSAGPVLARRDSVGES
jgi:hypothetical protein